MKAIYGNVMRQHLHRQVELRRVGGEARRRHPDDRPGGEHADQRRDTSARNSSVADPVDQARVSSARAVLVLRQHRHEGLRERPSANRRRSRFGMRKATKNASVQARAEGPRDEEVAHVAQHAAHHRQAAHRRQGAQRGSC
jgi:hypothetical protein